MAFLLLLSAWIVNYVFAGVAAQPCGDFSAGAVSIRCLFRKGDFVPFLAVAHGAEGPALTVIPNVFFSGKGDFSD